MEELFTIKINNGFYVSHSKNFFKRAASEKDAKKIQGKGNLLIILHSIYHSEVDIEKIEINKLEAVADGN